jgi:CreA protein
MTSRHCLGFARLSFLLAATLALPVSAEEIGCATTTWKLIGANHRVCIYAYDDPKIPGVACHVSQARTGGVKGSFGLAEDPSQFSLACRQIGPITLPAKLPDDEIVFSEDTSIFFKETNVHRFFDQKRNVLVYMAISRKIIEGAPANAISTVPIQPWGGK